MDPTTFTMKLFATKVRSFIIVTKSCILGEVGFKMNDYLTYFEAESFNAQLFSHFPFPFFKFWKIQSRSDSFIKWTKIPTGNGTPLVWNSSTLFLRLTYSQTVLFLLLRGQAKENLNLFGTIYTVPNPFALCKAKQ